MTDDEWWWTHLEKKDVCEVMRWCECTIFYPSSIYTAIQNVQNVEYSTIPKYTKYTEYTKYTKYIIIYNIFYHSFLYTLQYLHFPWFLQPGWTKSSLSASKSGVQTCTLLLHCKYWEPWQAESSLSTHMPRGVQIMLCGVPPKSRWDGRYIHNIYKYTDIYKYTGTKCICGEVFLHCDFKHFAVSDFGQTEKLSLG